MEPRRVRTLRRFALSTGNQNVNAAASQNAVSLAGPSLFLPVIEARQALRLIEGAAFITDGANTHFLTVLGAEMHLAVANLATTTPNLKQLRVWQPNYAGVIIGGAGIRWGFKDDEFVYGTDYLDLSIAGAQAGSYNLAMSADVSNSDAAIHAVTFVITVLVEIYQLDLDLGNGSEKLGFGGPLDYVRRPGT